MRAMSDTDFPCDADPARASDSSCDSAAEVAHAQGSPPDRMGAPPGPGGRYHAPPQPIRLFRSEELFGGGRIVCIEHAGATYRLQITARGKLILQK
jgi:hemin uptake protein HemP